VTRVVNIYCDWSHYHFNCTAPKGTNEKKMYEVLITPYELKFETQGAGSQKKETQGAACTRSHFLILFQ
jgi:hypothetical protein